MNIKRIELQSGGFKGANISFITQVFKNNRPFLNETIEKRKNPIHMDFEKLFKDLRIHLLDIYKINNIRLSESEKNTLLLETEVFSIEFDNDSFILAGELESFEDKKIKLKTCKVQQSDGYEGYDEVRSIIDSLKVEATSYLDGLKVVSDREMMLRWLEARKDQNMTKEQFELLGEDEQKEYMNKTLNAKFGANIEEEEVTEEDESVLEGINLTNDVIEIPDAPVKKGKKKNEVAQEEQGGAF